MTAVAICCTYSRRRVFKISPRIRNSRRTFCPGCLLPASRSIKVTVPEATSAHVRLIPEMNTTVAKIHLRCVTAFINRASFMRVSVLAITTVARPNPRQRVGNDRHNRTFGMTEKVFLHSISAPKYNCVLQMKKCE